MATLSQALLRIAPLCLSLWSVAVYGDDGKARFVSGSGVDTGDCLNKFRPCRSISYAVARSGKTDTIWVAEGEYGIRDSSQLGDLISIQHRVKAGFNKSTGFADRNASDRTLLVGVPPTLRERFEAAGFTVIADTKSLDVSVVEAKRMRTFADQLKSAEKSHSAAPCTSGVSTGFPCQNVSLASHLSLSALQPVSPGGADLWGYTDLNTGREYVVMGLQSGVAVVDVTDPEAPQQIAYATGTTTNWREVTIYQQYDANAKRWRAYAYVTTDGEVQDFLMILDLSGLPNSVEQVSFASDHRAAHTDYLVNADYTYGIPESSVGAQLVISGARPTNGGAFRLYSLSQPRAPQFLSQGNVGYTHDVASFGIADARKNTQCQNGATAAKCQVLTDFNETTIDVWDVTNPAAVQLLGRQSYANARYTHSGWWTEDGNFLFVHDEFDEQNAGLQTTVRVFDMTDLTAPTLVPSGGWVGPNRSIDHNGYVRGNRYYFSNYSEGLTVLDITDPRVPQRVGYFDTFPASAQTSFVGAWGAYPFFASGTIAVADINSGLYLLKNETLSSPQGSFTFSTPAVSASEGQSVTLTVSRTGGSVGAVSVDLDLLNATTDSTDYSVGSQQLNWADGENQSKSVTLALTADANAENLELLLVRLKNPRGGATLNYPETAQVRIAESGATTRLRLLDAAVNVNQVRERALIVVTRQGSLAGAASVNYATVPNSTYTAAPAQQGTVTWADGDGSAQTIPITFDATRLQVGQTGTFQVELSGAANAEIELPAGTAAPTTQVTINVSNPVPPAAPPAQNRRGGGQLGWDWLIAGLLLLAWRFGSRRIKS
jgi:choice-of-anchor B domain-containing protein